MPGFLRDALPAAASVLNPVDVLGDALAERYQLTLEAVLGDPNVGGVLVILTPQVMTQVEETARTVGELSQRSDSFRRRSAAAHRRRFDQSPRQQSATLTA